MNQDNLQTLIRDGLPALKAGRRIAAAEAEEIRKGATDSELKSPTGDVLTNEWDARIDRAMQEVGASGEGDNPVVEAHFQTAKYIRDAESDPQVRDLGIIAAGQLALHYWIAAFGTMAAYAKQAGLNQTAKEMGQSMDEAKQADEGLSQVAARIIS